MGKFPPWELAPPAYSYMVGAGLAPALVITYSRPGDCMACPRPGHVFGAYLLVSAST